MNRPWVIVLAIISLASPFIGLAIAGMWGVVVGLIIALIEFVVGLYAIGRVREITRGSSR